MPQIDVLQRYVFDGLASLLPRMGTYNHFETEVGPKQPCCLQTSEDAEDAEEPDYSERSRGSSETPK